MIDVLYTVLGASILVVVEMYSEVMVRKIVLVVAGAVSTLVIVLAGSVVVFTIVCGGPAGIVETDVTVDAGKDDVL